MPSLATYGVTGALRQLRRLTGEELFAVWANGDKRSRWGSLSARAQHKWEELATWVSEHAITEIDVTEKVAQRLGRMSDKPRPLSRSYPHENLTDEDLANEAEAFLKKVAEEVEEVEDEPREDVDNSLSASIDALAPVIAAVLKKLLT